MTGTQFELEHFPNKLIHFSFVHSMDKNYLFADKKSLRKKL